MTHQSASTRLKSEEGLAKPSVDLGQHSSDSACRQHNLPPKPALPFLALPSISGPTRRALDAAALEANDRYLHTFIEEHSICPFSRGGRAQGQTARFVHYVDSDALQPLIDLMIAAARDPSKAVVQVILPLIDVTPQEWPPFCYALTAYANAQLPAEARDSSGGDVFVVAPLHPELSFSSQNPFSLIPLFRRAPDPTIQWVRIDALDKLYENRSRDTIYIPYDELEKFLQTPPRKPLFDRIAESNMRMAQRLGIAEVERTLRGLHHAARARYADVLLTDEASLTEAHSRCPFHGTSDHAQKNTSPPPPPPSALFQQEERWAVAHLHSLPQRAPKRFLVDGIDIILIRDHNTVHALYGRCPHRLAPLSDGIVEQERIICPHHGWDFRLDSGHSEGVPGESIHRFTSPVEDGIVWIDAHEVLSWRSSHDEPFHLEDVIL